MEFLVFRVRRLRWVLFRKELVMLMFKRSNIMPGYVNHEVDIQTAVDCVMNPHEYHDPTDLLNDKLSAIRYAIGQIVAELHRTGALSDNFVETLVSPHFRKAGV